MTVKINKEYVSTKLGTDNVNKAINLLQNVYKRQQEITGVDLNNMLSAMFDDYTSKQKVMSLKKSVVLVPQKKKSEEQEAFLKDQTRILDEMKAEYDKSASKI